MRWRHQNLVIPSIAAVFDSIACKFSMHPPLKASWHRYVKNNSLAYAWASLGCTLLFYAILLTLYSLIPSGNTGNSSWHGTSLHAETPTSGVARALWVFLPLLGLKYARRHGMHSDQQHHDFLNTVQKERVVVQGWGLVADAIRSFASSETSDPFADVRIIGLVGNPLDCDPWLNRHASRYYKCVALPPQCLSPEFDEVPTVDCIFETILHHFVLRHNDNDVIVYTNGDLIFPASKLLVVLSFIYCHLDTSNKKDAILVGQRRDTPLMDDTDGAKFLKTSLLTMDNFQHFFSQALNTSVLHADVGVDYFILSAQVLSYFISTKGFPPFLVGRYRWDNALLASFILDEIASSRKNMNSSVCIKTIDITSVLSVVHLGQHSASPDYFQAQVGAEYNDRVAHEHFGDSYMLGRVHNTDWILIEAFPVIHGQGISNPVLKIINRANKVDADILQAFGRAYYYHHLSLGDGHMSSYGIKNRKRDPDGSFPNEASYPILLLVTVLPRDVPYAKLWMQYRHSQNASSVAEDVETHDHFLFVTVEKDSYDELEAAFPGAVILENAFAWPTSAVKWHSFCKLLRNRLTIGVVGARDVVGMSSDKLLPLLWQQTLSAECDVVLYQRQNNKSEDKTNQKEWDIFSIRPSPAGMMFWDEYKKHGQGYGVEQTDIRLLVAPRHQGQADDEKLCIVDLHANAT
jgi:hypothetical protein